MGFGSDLRDVCRTELLHHDPWCRRLSGSDGGNSHTRSFGSSHTCGYSLSAQDPGLFGFAVQQFVVSRLGLYHIGRDRFGNCICGSYGLEDCHLCSCSCSHGGYCSDDGCEVVSCVFQTLENDDDPFFAGWVQR